MRASTAMITDEEKMNMRTTTTASANMIAMMNRTRLDPSFCGVWWTGFPIIFLPLIRREQKRRGEGRCFGGVEVEESNLVAEFVAQAKVTWEFFIESVEEFLLTQLLVNLNIPWLISIVNVIIDNHPAILFFCNINLIS